MINLKVLDLSHHNVGPGGGDVDFAALKAQSWPVWLSASA